MDRRDFIKLLGLAGTNAAAYAACSNYMGEALAQSTVIDDLLSSSVHCQLGSLKNIEHVVILMQENRSFDHYYGTLRGVRGFGDPRPLKQRNAEPVWHQSQTDLTAQKVKPYHLPKGASADTDAGDVFLQDPHHGYNDGLVAWNNGLSDKWIAAKGIVAMAHYVETDIPLYFKLAKSFTICDSYFCSVNGPTDPNRSYFWTGTANGRTDNAYFSSKDDGVADSDPSRPDWKSYPEKLDELDVDWKFYQDGLTWTNDAFAGNYGDNTLEFFKQYRDPISDLYKKQQSPDYTIDQYPGRTDLKAHAKQLTNTVLRTDANKASKFEQDILDNKLPAVSWIVAPEAFTEHPKYPPHFGEYYLNEILRALLANKEVWHKTALIITYDENGGFFDHVLPPVPPLSADNGKTSAGITIPAKDTPRDFNTEYSVDGYTPIGMGIRVPTLIISPWTGGGRVCSETFDHTSIIRFLDSWLVAKGKQEANAPVFANISSWRQAIAGDLTSAFDFERTRTGPMDKLADTVRPVKIYSADEKKTAKATKVYVPTIADVNADPLAKKSVAYKQDQTQCDLLPIGYDFQVFVAYSIHPASGKKRVDWTIRNSGKLGASFYVIPYSRADGPWLYSVEGVKPGGAPIEVSDYAQIEHGEYAHVVHGPNGYLFEFSGSTLDPLQEAFPQITDVASVDGGKIVQISLDKWPTANGKLKVVNAYTGEEKALDPGVSAVDFTTRDGWYDVSFVDAINDNRYLRRYAGHLENGKISKTDPAIGLKYNETKRVYEAQIS